MPPATPPKCGAAEMATFSTPSAELFDTNPVYEEMQERALWSPVNTSFSSDYCAFGGGAGASHSVLDQNLPVALLSRRVAHKGMDVLFWDLGGDVSDRRGRCSGVTMAVTLSGV